MTERYGSGYGEEGSQRPSGRGAVTERLAGQDRINEIDLTDETTERESSGAFEPAETGRTGSSNIFDVDQRAKQEDQNPTGYEPSVADPDADPDAPRGETVVTEPGQPRDEPGTEAPAPAADAEAAEVPPAPVAEPPADAPAATEAPAAADAPAAGTPVLLGSLDAGAIRNRFLDIQAGFIDEPRQAVEEAGRFVDDLLRQVADSLQQQRGQLAGVTDEGSTEDLRLALRAYRQFVDRLLGLAS
ncbi:MAG TPA: hypothetical protein VFA73_10295 [Actinomycetota bacterium]|jgi:hypothetical protein|nr:hypothetical protein [Actinomycetota bacterium]